jgi:GPH family glycoside/pentoside/hexuronide:cation symporter
VTASTEASSPIRESSISEKQREDLRATRLGFGQKIGYAAGAMVDGVVNNVVNTFLLFYVTTVCGIPGSLAGIAAAVGLTIDAILDPLIGSMSDSSRSRWGRRLPYMAVGLPLLIASFVMLFALPDWADTRALFALLTLLSVSFRISLSVYNLPYLAVGAELTDDYAERSLIMTWRWGLGMVGAIIGIGLGFGVFFKGANGLANREAYLPFALALSIIIVLSAGCAMRAVHATRRRQHLPPRAGSGTKLARRLGAELFEMFRNRSFRILFISALLFFVAQGVTLSLGLHANTFFWHLSSDRIKFVTLSFFVGLIIGAPLSGPIVSCMEKRNAVLGGLLGLILMQSGPASLRLLGLLPLQDQALATLLATTTAIGGALMSMAAIAFTSMMADAADEHEYLFGARREGLYFAGWAFASKAANGLGVLVCGFLLEAIAFPVEQIRQGGLSTVLPQHMSNALGFCYGPGAALLSIVGALVLARYRLDSKAHAAILAKLRIRRLETIQGEAA